MGIFVKDSNINTGTVGSQGTNTQSVTVHNSTVDVSNIERGNSDINSTSQVTTVDLGDLINEGGSTAAEAANTTITNGSINVGDTNQTSSQTSNQNLQNSNTNTENINQQGESASKQTINNDQTKQDNVNQETGSASSKSASSGVQGGSTNQPTGTASKPASSSSGGKSGSSSGVQGGSATSGSMSGQGKQGAQGQKAGEVSGKAGSIKNTQSKVLELGGDISRTGATISNQKSITSKTKTTQGNSNKAHSNTGSRIGKGVRWFVKEIVHTVESIRATEAVLATTVMSAAGRILEKVFVDGLVGYVVSGVMDFIGADDIANDLRKFAARNLVGEANTWFYENTEMGKHINELSAIKYDSELAKKIESFSETVIKIAAATAISAVPGGVFILAAVGALEGMGGAAESAYQNALANGEEDLTLSLWKNLGILGSGALDAVAWIFNANLGKGFLSLAGDIGEIGLKETAINFGKQLFSKETLHNILDPKNLLPNMLQSGLQSGGEIGRIFSKFMNGEKIEPEDWKRLARAYGTYLFLNVVQDVLTDSIQNYKTVEQMKQAEYESSTPKEAEPEPSKEISKHEGYYNERVQYYKDQGLDGNEARKLATRDTVALELTEQGYSEEKAMKIADISIEGEGVKVETAIKVQQDIDAIENGEIPTKEIVRYALDEDPDYQEALKKLLPEETAKEIDIRTKRYKETTAKLERHRQELANLEAQRELETDPKQILSLDEKIKWAKDNVDGDLHYLDETLNLDEILEEHHKKLVEVYGDDALTVDQMKEILLTDQGPTRGEPGARTELPYLGEDTKLNKIQVEKFKTDRHYQFGDISIEAGETTGFKFCNTEYANDGSVGGFIANMDQIMDHIEEMKAKKPDMTLEEFMLDLEEYLDAKDFEHSSVVIYHLEPEDIRIPNGDEFGAWPGYWKPGGLTTNGGLEVQTTIDKKGIIQLETGKYEIITFEDFYKAIYNK